MTAADSLSRAVLCCVPRCAVLQGTNVFLGLNLYHVYGLELRRASISLQVWLRMQWDDPRYACTPRAHTTHMLMVAGCQSGTFSCHAAHDGA